MGRPKRIDIAGYAYHIINRSVGRRQLFHCQSDFAAFQRVLAQAVQRTNGDVQLIAFCLMPNHWHLVVKPNTDGALAPFMQWLTLTHTQRYRVAHANVGVGPLYQGRFKSFAIGDDQHLLNVCRYVERNAAQAALVQRAEDWPWSSLCQWRHPTAPRHDPPIAAPDNDTPLRLSPWPMRRGMTVVADGSRRPRHWLRTVNTPQSNAELEALRLATKRCRPYGNTAWVTQMITTHNLESTLRKPGRPKSRTNKTHP